MKNKIIMSAIVILFIVGLLFILYPTFSDCWNNYHQSKAIAYYIETVENLDENQFKISLNKALEYNNAVAKKGLYKLSKEDLKEYNELLNTSNNGIMGYIEIPKINIKLPIYHGTSESTLQVAIGHMTGSSLPIGGVNTNTVLLGHRGLPSAKLFTNLDKMEKGDVFYLYSLKQKLAYQVEDIKVVEPEEIENLKIVENGDYATLVTCTPYGINSHRLLVIGKRIFLSNNLEIENNQPSISIKVLCIILILFIIILMLLFDKKSIISKEKK